MSRLSHLRWEQTVRDCDPLPAPQLIKCHCLKNHTVPTINPCRTLPFLICLHLKSATSFSADLKIIPHSEHPSVSAPNNTRELQPGAMLIFAGPEPAPFNEHKALRRLGAFIQMFLKSLESSCKIWSREAWPSSCPGWTFLSNCYSPTLIIDRQTDGQVMLIIELQLSFLCNKPRFGGPEYFGRSHTQLPKA